MTLDLDNLRRLVDSRDGEFGVGTKVCADFDRDTLTFKSRACIDRLCNCVVPCTETVAEFDVTHEGVAEMLNALPALLADHARLVVEVATMTLLRGAARAGEDDARELAERAAAAGKLACADVIAARAEVARLRGLLDEALSYACDGANEDGAITRIRKEAAGG